MGLFSALLRGRPRGSYFDSYCYAVVEDEHRVRLITDGSGNDTWVDISATYLPGNYVVDARLQGKYLFVVYYDNLMQRNVVLRYTDPVCHTRLGG